MYLCSLEIQVGSLAGAETCPTLAHRRVRVFSFHSERNVKCLGSQTPSAWAPGPSA